MPRAFPRRALFSAVHPFDLMHLEARVMLSASAAQETPPLHAPGFCACPVCSALPVLAQLDTLNHADSTASSSGDLAAAGVPLASIPLLSSNPAATAKLYLDFDGHAAMNWDGYSVPTTPAYDIDGDPYTFSSTELSNIQQIWERVAEKYSPFNIDVTTIEPASFADKVGLRVVIGGNGAWTGGTYGGVAMTGSFAGGGTNIVWVFEDNLANGNVKYTAEAIAHEAGHAFGLQHQSTYSSTGTKTAEYSTGNGSIAPIMGNSYYATRGIWWNGTTTSATTTQDNLAVLSNSTNGFGYRPDDHGNTPGAATPLLVSGTSVSGRGIIQRMDDVDYFSFTTDTGTLSLSAMPFAQGGMLDLKLALYTSTGTLVASASTSSLGESIAVTVPAGSYRVAVASQGNYGDLGQYTISGTIVPPADFVAAPSGLTAVVVSATQVQLAWADQSDNETGFVVQRSADGGATWINLANTAANVASFLDGQVAAGVTYSYRVYATGTGANSEFSNVASATAVPAAPSSLSATAVSASQINLVWSDVNGETGYRLERSLDGASWSVIANVGANVSSFQNTGLAAGTKYFYRVIATGVGGNSAASPLASATTQTAAVPLAPSNLTAKASAANKIALTWKDNSSDETGFVVERSADGVNWSQRATVKKNATTWTDNGLSAGTYFYRVAAYNSNGSSPYTGTASAAVGSTTKGQPKAGKSAGQAVVFSTKPVASRPMDLLAAALTVTFKADNSASLWHG